MADDLNEAAEPAPAAAAEPAKYTSVVYVHGMGDQRRYEETSRLIDKIDKYLFNRFQESGGKVLGVLSKIKARVEPCRAANANDAIIGYIRTTLVDTPQKMQNPRTVRFYEVYWAPVMAEQKSAWAIVKWMFAQVTRPWQTLFSHWRERQRLRRATLAGLFERKDKLPPGTLEEDYATLVGLYDEFEGPPAQRAHADGRYAQFVLFIDEQLVKEPAKAARCKAITATWLSAYRKEQGINALVLLSIALALPLAAGAGFAIVQFLLQALVGWSFVKHILEVWHIEFVADWKAVLSVLGGIAGFAGFTAFLTNYMGDVQAWATYEETDSKHVARNKVIDQTLDVLTHVLNDPNCERVAVVSHSLGTSVAHDALLALTRRNRSANPQNAMQGVAPLDKIEHFVTMGSPIDKIEYFFESYESASHRYKRVVETLRGDIGTEPFSKNRHPHVHWVNFWDQGDPISGALQSPASGNVFSQRVDNHHIISYSFPSPGKSHGGYFDNKTVIHNIFEMVYLRARSFSTVPRLPTGAPDYASAYLGLGEKLGARQGLLFAALLVPWVALVAVILWVLAVTFALNLTFALYLALGILALLIAVLAAAAFVSKHRDQLNPL